jgi:hypothetical protein
MKKGHGVAVATFVLSLVPALPGAALGQAASPLQVVKAFSPAGDTPITRDGVKRDQGGWRIEPTAAGPVRLFEVTGPTCDACRLVYRAKLRARTLQAPAFLEMWVRLPDKGQFFSRGLDQVVSGSVDWMTVEIPFFLQKGQQADLVKLNVSFQGGGGSLWIKDVELLKAPLPSP